MMQAAQPLHRNNPVTGAGLARGFPASGRSLCQCEMSAVLVVIANVIIHETFQMLLVQNNHMVEQISAAVANPALGEAVLPWAPKTGPLWLDIETPYRLNHFFVELSTAIKDQVTGRGIVRERFPQLLDHPGAGSDAL